MKISRGTNRIVVLIGKYAVKIPNFINGHLLFLTGSLANYREREYCRMMKNIPDLYNLVCPSLWCSWFGLIQIQKRAKPVIDELSDYEFSKFDNICDDLKNENFGYYHGRLVCIDYG